jgi:hypothetical protein
MEHGPLFEANRDFHLICERVNFGLRDNTPLLFDHGLEVHVDLNSLKLIIGLSFGSELTRLFHFHSSLITFELNLVNFVCCSDLTLQLLVALKLLSPSTQVYHRIDILSWEFRFFSLGLDPVLLFEPIFTFGCSTISRQSFLFKLIHDLFCCHRVNLSLFLHVFELSLLHYSLLINFGECLSTSWLPNWVCVVKCRLIVTRQLKIVIVNQFLLRLCGYSANMGVHSLSLW